MRLASIYLLYDEVHGCSTFFPLLNDRWLFVLSFCTRKIRINKSYVDSSIWLLLLFSSSSFCSVRKVQTRRKRRRRNAMSCSMWNDWNWTAAQNKQLFDCCGAIIFCLKISNELQHFLFVQSIRFDSNAIGNRLLMSLPSSSTATNDRTVVKPLDLNGW